MLVTRPPCPALQPYVRQLWALSPGAVPTAPLVREHVLPTGDTHLAFRLGGPALRIFHGAHDAQGEVLGHAVVGGARSCFHIREAGGAGGSVGALLKPGGARALLGVPADALAGRHTPLDALWGPGAARLLDQLHEAGGPHLQLDWLEAVLLARVAQGAAAHPAVALALARLRGGATVAKAVQATGLSHRSVLTLVRQATGLAPKEYTRVHRLQAVLRAASCADPPGWAQLALQAGFSDQAHFSREFRAFAGLTPQAWRRAAPRHPSHVPAPSA